MTVAVAPTDPALLRGRFDAALAAFLDAREPGRPDDGTGAVHTALRWFVLAGGKRMRPLFCYWGWRGFGGPDASPIVVAAASLELFHAFALIHDDIVDRSDRRRGAPTLHRFFAGLHARCGWQGDPAAYGRQAAVLCGVLCATWSAEMFHGCGLPPERLRRGHMLLVRMRSEVIAGEYLDVVGAAGDGSVASALTVVRLKTARYTVTRPVQIGAALAGAAPEEVAALAGFGDPLGDAFQLRDDLLGVFGDPSVTGKSNLDDLREGKPTVLLALARASTSPAGAARLGELVGDPGLDQAGAAEVRGIVEESGAREAVERMIRTRADAALVALDALPLAEPARRVLAALAERAVDRHE
ncbi:polyprenyl synthetase family protein [Micromonospora tulbaghiae]